MLIIGFTGKQKSGKTMLSNYLYKEYGFINTGFKSTLITEILDKFPILLDRLMEIYNIKHIMDLFVEKPPAMRALMQEYGTDVRRNDDKDYWVKRFVDMLDKMKEDGCDMISVDDVRFLNEADTIKKQNGKVIMVRKPGCDGDGHISEKEMDLIEPDFFVDNSFDKDYAYKQLDEIMEKLNIKKLN